MSFGCIYKQWHTARWHAAEQSNATQSVNEKESNNSYPTDSPVAQTVYIGGTVNDHDTENFSKLSSAKQRCEERAKKFNIELQTKLRLEQVQLERKKLEMETQTKEQKSSINYWGKKVS